MNAGPVRWSDTHRPRLCWILAVAVFLLAPSSSGCDDSDEETTDDTSDDTVDLLDQTDTASQMDTSLDDEGDGFIPACESLVVPGEVVRAQGEPCVPGERCERGTLCVADVCRLTIGCTGVRLNPDEGCVVETRTMDLYSTPECECDDACRDSPHGSYCVMKVCQPYPPCGADGSCPVGSSCYPDRSTCPSTDMCFESICFPDE